MASQKLIESSGNRREPTNKKVTLGVIIFLAGIIAGVIGLCVALRVIFYIGLAVALVAAVAIVVGIITLRRRFDGDD